VSSSRPSSARSAKAAQIKIEQERAAQRRHRQIMVACVGIGAVVCLFAALISAKVAGAGSSHHHTVVAAAKLTPTDVSDVVTETTGVPASVLDQVGAGSLQAAPTKVTAPPLTSDGKPEVIYFGYEWCPYCATERWPMVVALSRFGTFTGLGLTQSAGDDVFPSTNTFTFAKSTYTSQYLAFTPIELQDANRNTLETPTAAQAQVLQTYDAAPYVTSAGSLPFVDLGGSYLVAGASYDPQVLAGQTWDQIAGSLATASSPVAQGVDGTANVLTAAICVMTHQQPASVCTSAAVTSVQGKVK
jgi:Domain of unknown function (DUF929)